MKVAIVVGLGYGDEGKGLVTSYLVSKANRPLVTRCNGGHQAGHTVVHNGVRHVFSSYGSGTLQGAPSYIDQACVIYPTAIVNEYNSLRSKTNNTPILGIHPLCPVTTPWEVWRNRKLEDMRTDSRHGSVGVGFGETLERESRHFHLLAQDLLYPKVFTQKLDMIIDKYYHTKVDKNVYSKFISDVDKVRKLVNITAYPDSLYDIDDIVCEGAQGILLDQKFGFYPHVTRSNTTTQNILDDLIQSDRDMGMLHNIDIYYVTRSYATRHGAGPFAETELNLKNNEDETNKLSDYQGSFKVSTLDTEMLNYALACDAHFSSGIRKHIVFTCMDQHELDIDKVLSKLDTKFETVLTSYGPSATDIKEYSYEGSKTVV